MKGIRVYDKEKVYKGYTLFCPTARGPSETGEKEHPIYLIDMEGEVVHEWKVASSLQSYCHLLPNGNLMVPTHDRSEVDTGKAGLTEISPDSQVLWYYRCRTDHEFQVLENDNILINTITEYMWPELGKELKRHPYIIEINRNKDLIWEWKGEEHIAELKDLLDVKQWNFVQDRIQGQFAFDWAHNNTAQIIPPNKTYEIEKQTKGTAVFKPGNIFISYRSLDVIGVIERETGRIVWAWGPGIIDGQHKPHMLESGNVLIFDNGTLRGYSRVIELNPLTGEIEWEYTAEPKESFFSQYISSAQRLPNGNTLICEGNRKRLFEVTRDNKVVWEFVNPYHRGKSETIYRCLRYSEEYCKPLLDAER